MIAAINWQFAQAPGMIDPRASFSRTTTAMVTGPTGFLQQVAADVPRFEYDPLTFRCRGLLMEQQRTNYFLRSQEFSNAAWTKASITVTADSAVAPDNTTTADTIEATGAGAGISQAVTITAGRGVVASFYLKANASQWAYVLVSDGTNNVVVWFNLAAKATGTSTGGSGTLLFTQAFAEDVGRGWVRCSVECTTATITTVSSVFAPCAADGADTANGNSLYAWGAQFEAEQTGTSVSSYIPTTSATVTRNADNLSILTSAMEFNDQAGTIFFSVFNRPVPVSITGITSPMYGGFGDSGANADRISVQRSGSNTIGGTVQSSSGGANPLSAPSVSGLAFPRNTRRRTALAWALNDLAIVIDSAAPVLDSAQDLPVAANLVRFTVGGAPWGATSQYSVGQCIFEAVQYIPARVATADLQLMCAA